MTISNKKLYEDDLVVVNLNQEINTIEYTWKTFVNFDDYKKLLEKVYQFTKENGCKKNLVDMREMKVIPNDAQIWVAQNWLPKMAQMGMNTFALVNTKSIIAKMSLKTMEQIIPLKEGDMTSAYFDEIEEARKWLATK